MFKVIWDAQAQKELDKLEFLTAKRIVQKVQELEEDPFVCDVIRLRGSPDFRLRVGDYRIIFAIKGNHILILKVGHRKHIYEK
jgi:mRNA interferase RelE/StbE